jgi:hypothetical protein
MIELGLEFQERIKHIKPGESGIMLGGEQEVYRAMGLILIVSIFILVCFANAIFRKENKFYLWLSAIIIIQLITVLKIA